MKKRTLFHLPLLLLVAAFNWACSSNRAEQPAEELYVFLCLGQSNMEGHARVEAIDTVNVSERLLVMQGLDCPDHNYQKGQWRKAVPPLVRCDTGLSPADYFGRTLVDSLPQHVKVGIINVAVGGCRIELFDKDNYQAYVDAAPKWLRNITKEYNDEPYELLIELAKNAQSDGGTIKGVLLHQGESNTGEADWPIKVRRVYNSILADLNLEPNSIPLLAGEVVGQDQSGSCASMNDIINTLPKFIDNTYIISSEGCEKAEDNIHFSAAGYRLLGKRYGEQMLQLINNN